MAEILSFEKVHNYNTTESGITVTASLRFGQRVVVCDTKLDTRASFCIFERAQGEVLGIDIESGTAQRVGAPIGSFLAYGHEVSISVLGIETAAVVYFAEDENFSRNVLGRQGWLDRVRLGLIDYEGKLYLSDYNDPA